MIVGVLVVAAGACTSEGGAPGSAPSVQREPVTGEGEPAVEEGEGWFIELLAAHTEAVLRGPAGSYRPSQGEVFLVVDLRARHDNPDAVLSSDELSLTDHGVSVPAVGGAMEEGVYCVECSVQAPATGTWTELSVIFVLPEEAANGHLQLEGGWRAITFTPELGASERAVRSENIAFVAGSAPERPTISSDLAFWGDLAVAGSYDGFRVIDVSDPEHPDVLAEVACRARQGDVSVWEDLVFLSNDTPTTTDRCNGKDTEADTPGAFEGIRIFDVSDPSSPRLVRSVRTDCGSHTHTLVPDLPNRRVLLYVSSYAPTEPSLGPSCRNPHAHISVVEVPLSAPSRARVISRPSLPGLGAYDFGAPGFLDTAGCHDISVFMPLDLAAAACMSEGQLWDISDPVHPRITAHIRNADVAFWHSASFSWDGKYVLFGDEYLFQTPGCRDDRRGAIWFYEVADPEEPVGHFTLPRPQGEDPAEFCTAHNFAPLPIPGRYLLVSAFYTGGTSVIDFGDPAHPVEIAYYDAVSPRPSNVWSSYWYDGLIYSNDLHRGVDIFDLDLPDVDDAVLLARFNPQTQERLLRGEPGS